MQQNYPKVKGVYQQMQEPNYMELTYENVIKALHKLFYGTEMPEEEVQKMVKEYQDRQLKLTDRV